MTHRSATMRDWTCVLILSVVVKMSCWDSCFPKGLSQMERRDGNSRVWHTVVVTELADRWILCVPISYTVAQEYKY